MQLLRGAQVIATTACMACERVFAHDPALVPRLEGLPLCQLCTFKLNQARQQCGLAPVLYDAGAYP